MFGILDAFKPAIDVRHFSNIVMKEFDKHLDEMEAAIGGAVFQLPSRKRRLVLFSYCIAKKSVFESSFSRKDYEVITYFFKTSLLERFEGIESYGGHLDREYSEFSGAYNDQYRDAKGVEAVVFDFLWRLEDENMPYDLKPLINSCTKSCRRTMSAIKKALNDEHKKYRLTVK